MSWNNNISFANWNGNNGNNSNSPNVKISSIQTNYISSGLIQSGVLSTLNLNVSSINGSNITEYGSSNWSKYPAIQNVDFANNNANNIATTNTNAIVVGNGGQLWNGNAQFNGTGNLFSPYWYNFTMDANITTGQSNQQYPPTNTQYFSQYDITHNSFDAESITNNLTFNNAHLGINSQTVAVLPVGNVILESKNYKLITPITGPISYLAGTYRGSAYLGVNGFGPSAYIRMNYDSLGNYIPNNSALIEINADSVTGVTPLASSRVRTTAGKCDMLGTYGATMTAGTYISFIDPDLNSNYRATAEFKLYGYSIVGIPEPITGNAGTATLTVTGSNRLTGDTYGNSVITITATRATTNTLGYNATVNINADDHIYLNTYRTHLNGNENYIGNTLIGFNSLDITNVNSIQVSNILNDGGINILNDLLLNNNSIYNVNSISNLGYINILTDLDLNNNNIYNVNDLLASNIKTNNFTVSTINIMSNNTQRTDYSFSNILGQYNYYNPPIVDTKTNPYNSIYNISSSYLYTYPQISNYINTSNITLVIGSSNYYRYTCDSNNAYNQAFINTLTSSDIFGLNLRIVFGWSNSIDWSDFYNTGTGIVLEIEPTFTNTIVNGHYNLGNSNFRAYSDYSNSNILFSNIPITPYINYCNVSSLYTSQLSTIQGNSSITQSITFSNYDTNNTIHTGRGEYILDCSILKVNSISSGSINNIPNISLDSISTNRISTGILQTGFIQFTGNGGAGLFTTQNHYRNYGGLLALSNVDFYLNNQDIVGVYVGDFNKVSTNSAIIKSGNISTLVGNSINVSTIYVSTISTNKLSVSQIENVSTLTCGNISTNTLSVYQIENVSSITCGNISTNTLSVYQIESVSSLIAPRISTVSINCSNVLGRNANFPDFVSSSTGYFNAITSGYITGSNGTLNYNSESIFPNRASANLGYQLFNNSGCWNNVNALNANISSISHLNGNPTSTVNMTCILRGDIFLPRFLSSATISTNTITGLGGYFSSISAGSIVGGTNQASVTSTIIGLATFGYISSSQLVSTVTGLGNIYISSAGAGQTSITSTIIGLGTLGYISSSQLTSTVRGLGNIYLSTATNINSTIDGLGTLGYISSSQLTSTVKGLGNIYVSTPSLTSTIVGWSGIPANKNINAYGNNIINVNTLFADTISPSHNDYVLFDGNGIQTNTITSADFTQISFNNDINLEQHYNLKDALSLQISDGSNQTYMSNDSTGAFNLSNTTNTLILQGNLKIDTISGNINPYISFTNRILVDNIGVYSGDYVQFPNGLSVDNIYSLDTEINFNNNVFFGGHDLSGANNFSFIGTKPIYSSGPSGTDNDIIFQNSIDMSNNSIINLFGVYTDYIDTNSNAEIFLSKSINLNNQTIKNVNTIQVDFIKPNNNDYIDFLGYELSNISKIDLNNLTASNISTINISSSAVYASEVYTNFLGNPNNLVPTSIRVNNGLDIQGNNISNVSILSTLTLNVSSINKKQYPFWSTLSVPPSSFTIDGNTVGVNPFVFYSNVTFPTTGLFNISQKMISQKLSGGTSADIHGSLYYSRGKYSSSIGLYDGDYNIPYTNENNVSSPTTLFTSVYVSSGYMTRNISYMDKSANNYTANIFLDTPIIQYIPSLNGRGDY